MICSNGRLPVLFMRHCFNKCSYPMQQFKKVSTLQEQQTRQFWPTSIVRNSSGIASSMPALDVTGVTAKNEKFQDEEEGKNEVEQQEQVEGTGKHEEFFETDGKEDVGIVPTTLAQRTYFGRNNHRPIHFKYEIGKSGNKFLHIKINIEGTINSLPNIHVPQDLFGFVRAMDEVLEEVHAKRAIIEASSNRQKRLVLHTASAKGKNYGYRLELYLFNNTVCVQMRTVPNEQKPKHKSKFMFISLHQFHWLRNTIGELFTANGEENVQQQLGKPPGYPNWLNLDGIPFVLLIVRHNRLQQRPINSKNIINLGFANQQGIRQPPSITPTGYNNQNQYDFNRNLLPDNRHSLQLPQPQSMQFDQRQLLPQRVAPIKQQSAQPAIPEMPSSSSWAAMSEQLLQLVFLQQQQLQQIQSAILKDQPMGGVGGAISQKFGPTNTNATLMSDLLAQAPQPQNATIPRWNGNSDNVGYRKNMNRTGNRYSSNQGYRTDDEY